jgi:DNA-directed RNA polymerase subunit N (RpoN/RPB10)
MAKRENTPLRCFSIGNYQASMYNNLQWSNL